MTYIEFFDRTATENICACLALAPEQVVFVGDNGGRMSRACERYRKMFEKRGREIAFSYKSVNKNNLKAIVEALTSLVNTYDDCCFDVTGGDESILVALGIVLERFPDKQIQIHRVNLHSNRLNDTDMDGRMIEWTPPELSAEENIRIYGGDVAYGALGEKKKTYLWDMNDTFCEDVKAMWSICRTNVRLWNTQIGVFEAIAKIGGSTDGGLTVTAPVSEVKRELKKHDADYVMLPGYLKSLHSEGLLTAYAYDESTVTLSFKDLQVRQCLTVMGLALEMNVYMTASQLKDEQGKKIYNDAVNGVVIDWDGAFHTKKDNVVDTVNEIDVLLMRGAIPIFVSCKNGKVTMEELYKLQTVATHFGVQYAKRILIATALADQKNAEEIRQRAKDMGIRLLEGLTFENKLATLWET